MATPTWYLVLQTLANIAIAGTFVVYLLQLRAMQAQVTTAREATRNQNAITVHQFIVDPDFRRDRGVLIGLQGKPLASWSADERAAAERACAMYNFIGFLVAKDIVSSEMVQDAAYSIKKCHDAAAELLADVRATRSADHWRDFTTLAQRLG